MQRHYYYCRPGRHGFCPCDQILGRTTQDLSPAAEQLVCWAGVRTSFAEAAEKVLAPLANLRLAESTVERVTAAAGQRLAEAGQAGPTGGPAQAWAGHKDAEGKTVADVSADATGVGQPGPGGSQAEGRRANVVMVDNPVPEERERRARRRGPRPAGPARSGARLEPMSTLGEPLRRPAAPVGIERAERWIARSDGGAGREELLRGNFGWVEEVLLDFDHVAEHRHDFATLGHPADAEAAQALAGAWCPQRKHEGGAAVQEVLHGLDLRGRSGAVREAHRQLVGYFVNQVHRMD